jgi:predicted phage baseplate assembly protein
MSRRTIHASGAFLSRAELLQIAVDAQTLFIGNEAPARKALDDLITSQPAEPATDPIVVTLNSLGQMVKGLLRPKSRQPANSGRLARSVDELMKPGTETRMQLLQASFPKLREQFEQAFANSQFQPSSLPLQEVYALRRTAMLFGAGAPKVVTFTKPQSGGGNSFPIPQQSEPELAAVDQVSDALHLDRVYDGVSTGGWVIIRDGARQAVAARIDAAGTVGRSDYDINAETLRLQLSQRWVTQVSDTAIGISFADLRRTIVFLQSEPLTLTRVPRTLPVGLGDDKTRLDLDSYCPGLASGRRVILSGERTDIAGTSGIIGTELLMLAGVEQNTPPGETPYTTLLFANKGLAYTYRRGSVTIRANVVPATHGETKEEILGSGDASVPMQRFDLRSSPLTWVSATTPSGVATTLSVRVNKVRWDEIDSLAGADANAQRFTSRTSDDARTSVTFGTGREGSRVPTGANNVTAVYRVGIGREGNVATGQLTLLATRPLGVKEVINPIRASGGADAETRDQARANVPVALQALDRLVSLRDYDNFARTFAGIAKASAQRFPGGRRPRIHLTIAGDADNLIEETSDLHNNLVEALQRYGDPYLPTIVVLRDRITVMLSARVQLDPRYLWDTVEPAIRAALTAKFGFEQRDLGQTLYPSEVVSAIQSVAGVVAVDLDDLRGITATEVLPDAALPTVAESDRAQTIRPRLAHLEDDPKDSKKKIFVPAQIAYITPEVADTVVLKEIKLQ